MSEKTYDARSLRGASVRRTAPVSLVGGGHTVPAPSIEHRGTWPAPTADSASSSARPLWLLDWVVATVVAGLFGAVDVAFGLAPPQQLLLVPLLATGWVVCLALARTYETRYLWAGSAEVHRVMAAAAAMAIPVLLLGWMLLPPHQALSVIAALGTILIVTLFSRWLVRISSQKANRAGYARVRVLVVGPESDVEAVTARIRRNTYHGWKVIASCTPGRDFSAPEAPIRLGGPSDVVEAARRCSADVVLVCQGLSVSDVADLRQVQRELEAEGRELAIAPPLVEAIGPRVSLTAVTGLPIVRLGLPELDGPRRALKAVADRAVAAFTLLVLLPAMLVIALAIRVSSPGPAMFRQTRIGVGGRPFTVLKFRTMYIDAEERKLALLEANEGAGLLFKMKVDPRVTKVGALLRRTSLDELPQIVNILRGDMSFVGPRPGLPVEAEAYDEFTRRRLLVRPGLTGLWQIHGRSDLSWAETRRLDVRYVENWSIGFDLSILARTVEAVLKGRGAY